MKLRYIDIIAPSSAPPPNFDISIAREQLAYHGYSLRMPAGLVGDSVPYHANTDSKRYKYTLDALENEESEIIWALRGGYGAAKVVENLKSFVPGKEKILIGFSDITALLLFVNQKFGWKAIHGMVLSQIGDERFNQDNFNALISMLANPSEKRVFAGLKIVSERLSCNEEIAGKITGGNLSIIVSSIGTDWQIDARGKILIIEDVNERGYKIDRMLHQLKSAGMLDGVLAMICNFTGGDEADGSSHIDYMLHDFAKQVDFPVFLYDKIGHGYDNLPFVIGGDGTIAPSNTENYTFYI